MTLPDGSKRLQGLRTILVNIKPVKTGWFRTTNGCGTTLLKQFMQQKA